ncbi:MAG: DUF6310 domain-containing protein [Acidobacteriota bacterium]|nr:DUF6310 domain-containing protein [Acidobacteriota bacterium]
MKTAARQMRAVRAEVASAAAPRVQAKLRVSTPGDADEREADRIADLLVSTSRSDLQPHAIGEGVQRACCSSCSSGGDCQKKKEETEKPLHLSAVPNTTPSALDSSFEPILSSLRGGEPLPIIQRRFFENRLHHDFGAVRVHHDPPAAGIAQRLGARAFTLGNDIGFAGGEYAPHHPDGLRLLGHELTHVLQQRRGGIALRRKLSILGQGAGDPPATHIDVDRKTGAARVYVDGVLVMKAQFSGSAAALKIDTRVDASGKLFIAASVTPGASFEIIQEGLEQLSKKFSNLDFTAAGTPEQLPQPEQIVIFKTDPELSLPVRTQAPPEPQPERPPAEVPDEGIWASIGEWVHGALDVAGVVPGFGEIADGINAVIYVAEGRYAEAAISAAAMVPIVGDLGKIGKWTVKAGKEIAEVGTESVVKHGVKETAQQVEKEVVEREVKEVAEEGAEGAAKQADEAAVKKTDDAAETGTKKKDEPDDPCTLTPVRHAGGHARHNACADSAPPNLHPGRDVKVRGKRFDALGPGRILWEIKTHNYSAYSPWLKNKTLTRQVPEATHDLAIALSCGYGFIFGVTDEQHRADLQALVPFVAVRRVSC